VTRCIEHVRAEAGQETAAVLERMLKEQKAPREAPPQPEFAPTAPPGGVREPLPPSRTKLLVVLFSTVVVLLLLAVAVLVTVVIVRPPATTTAPPSSQAASNPAGPTTTPPTSTTTSSTSVPPPAVSPLRQAWPQLERIVMPGDTNDWGATSIFRGSSSVMRMISATLKAA
jgi:cytoskeletal protein RodZ